MKRLPHFKRITMHSSSFHVMAFQLPKLHDASFQTIILRVGLKLKIISPLNFANEQQMVMQ